MKHLISFLLLVSVSSSASEIAASYFDIPFSSVRNQSSAFEEQLKSSQVRDLSTYHFLFVRGFQSTPLSTLKYFQRQSEFVRRAGATFSLVTDDRAYSQFQSMEENAAVIANLIHRTPRSRQLIIVSHSKGSMDTLEALLKVDTVALSQVALWISIQGNIKGAPVVDAIQTGLKKGTWKDWLDMKMMKWLSGVQPETFNEMSVQARRSYLRGNHPKLKMLCRRLPIFSYTSRVLYTQQVSRFKSIIDRVHQHLPKRASKWMPKNATDGMIPSYSAILPCGKFVVDDRVAPNHYESVARAHSSWLGQDRKQDEKILRALLATAL